ncbi:MAG: trypsin-like peptidase domain-containing protein [Acidimicrobiales bacterium]
MDLRGPVVACRTARLVMASVVVMVACGGDPVGPAGHAAGDTPAEAAVYAVRTTSCSTGQEHRAVAVALTDRLVVTVAHVFTDAGRFAVRPAGRVPNDSDPNDSDPNDSDPNDSDPNDSDPNDTDPNDTDPNDSDPNDSDPNEGEVGARLVGLDTDRDLAVIALDGPTTSSLPTAAPVTGATVDMITVDPGPVRRPLTVLRQIDVTVDGAGRRRGLELEGTVELGDSGSPLLNGDGSVVGLVFAESRGAERGWAVSSGELDDAIAATEPDGPPIVLACR